jgi:4-hydroxy-4-methyl-2-oxoglutarate aldolase
LENSPQKSDDRLELCARLRILPVAVTSDVLAAMGLPDQALSSRIASLDPNSRIAGPALCLKGDENRDPAPGPGESHPVFVMDRRIFRGCVAMIATGGHQVGAVIGGNIGISWQLRGCVGIVTDGGVRDAQEFVDMGMPTFASFITPLSNKGRWSVKEVEVPIELQGQTGKVVRIEPGDLIHGDRDGIAVIPHRLAAQCVEDAELYEAVEKRIQIEVERGDDREEVYGRHDRLAHIRKRS